MNATLLMSRITHWSRRLVWCLWCVWHWEGGVGVTPSDAWRTVSQLHQHTHTRLPRLDTDHISATTTHTYTLVVCHILNSNIFFLSTPLQCCRRTMASPCSGLINPPPPPPPPPHPLWWHRPYNMDILRCIRILNIKYQNMEYYQLGN